MRPKRRIGLSLRAIADDDERNRLEDYQRQAAAATMTIEEVIKQQKGSENSANRTARAEIA